MKNIHKLISLFFLTYSFLGLCDGGTTPAAALSVPISLPFANTSGQVTTGDDVNNPVGFASAFTTGYDWFYYVCPTNSGDMTTKINYAAGDHPSISVWNGVPGAGGTLVSSTNALIDANVTLSVDVSVVAGTCYYIMIDNWPTPNGFSFTISIDLAPKSTACNNIGFENKNFDGWKGSTGKVLSGLSSDPYPKYAPNNNIITSSSQHIICTSGFDPVVGGTILPKVCPTLQTHSVQLGDGAISGANGASLERQFNVDASNALFTYYYAVVFQNPGHPPYQQPVFKVDVIDCNGNEVNCGNYLVVASSGATGFVNIPKTTTYYKLWTPVFLDLSPFIGSCVTIRFTSLDCSQTGHYGYAYVDAVCNPIQITGVTSICEGENATLSAPVGGASYSWNIQGDPKIIATTQTISISPTSTTTYECVITSVNNCLTVVTSSPIIVNKKPTSYGTLSSCVGGTSQFTGSPTADISSPWTSSNTSVASISNVGLVTGLAVGTSTITYKNTGGCSVKSVFTVNSNPTITGILSACIGGTSQLTGSETPDLSSPWVSSNPSIASISSLGMVTAIALGTTTITYKNLNGCIITTVFSVINKSDLNNPGPQSVCDSYNLPVITGTFLTGKQNYYTNSQTLGGNVLTGPINKTQTIWIADNIGACSDEESFLVTINPTPTITFSPDTLSGCAPLSVVFSNTSSPKSDSVYWTFGDGTSASLFSKTETITHKFSTVGCFDIALTSYSSGCSNNLSKNQLICTFQPVIADFSVDKSSMSINPTFEFTNRSSYSTIYNWDFGDASTSEEENPNHEYSQVPTKYTVTLLANNDNNCPSTKIIEIKVLNEVIFYVPNTFTPDDDKLNLIFKPIFTSGFDPNKFIMYIFNRWGEIVFETHDSKNGWDGTLGVDGSLCQDGTYTWQIKYSESYTENENIIVGHVNLLR